MPLAGYVRVAAEPGAVAYPPSEPKARGSEESGFYALTASALERLQAGRRRIT
jgi:hypothetical protein